MKNSKSVKKSGVLWGVTFGVLSISLWIFVIGFLRASAFFSGVIAVFFSILLSSKLIGKPSFKLIVRSSFFVIIVMIAFRFLFLFFIGFITPHVDYDEFKEEKEGVGLTYIKENNDSIAVYSSHRIWKDNYGNSFKGSLIVRDKDYQRLKNSLQSWTPKDSTMDFWGELYQFLEKKDGPSLDLITVMFQEIHNKRRLNQMEFAEMVVSCIQDIPYSFIFQEPCLASEHYEYDIRKVLERCPTCCKGNVRFGIQNPISFMQNLKGDCDTRTVIIYSILKHFDYDVAILNSDFYRHSILGINIPGAGNYKIYNGKKYRVWETTAKYFEVGAIPSNFSGMKHWEVVLTSK